MKRKKNPRVLSEPWQAAVRTAALLKARVLAQGRRHVWPIQGLAVRSASLSAAAATLIMRNYWSEAFVLGRTLMEIEITMKWLTDGSAASQRLKEFVDTIQYEQVRLVRKGASGVSVTAQVFCDVMKERLERESASTDATASEPSGSSEWGETSIRDRARACGLEDNYDFMFWQVSCYAHAHPLSVIEFAPPELDLAIRHLFSGNLQSGYVRDVVERGLPAQILHTIGTANDCLGLGMADDLARAWKVFHRAEQVRSGAAGITLEWRSPDQPGDLPPRGMRLVSVDGSHKDYVPTQVAPTGRRTNRRR
jgi:hypothetical protein